MFQPAPDNTKDPGQSDSLLPVTPELTSVGRPNGLGWKDTERRDWIQPEPVLGFVGLNECVSFLPSKTVPSLLPKRPLINKMGFVGL